ncbi:MAG TPA: hypothetical protein VF064_00285 [Pyrinomonadaceae bacterium]
MRLKLYCNRYAHFKDALVCSVSCVYRTRCHDFALFYDGHREDVDALVADYYAGRREGERKEAERPSASSRQLPLAPVAPTVLARPEELRNLIRLEVKRKMTEAYYIWVDREDRAELLDTAEVLKRAERGHKAKSIYRVSQEMELRYQLVPRKRIEKAKRVAAEDAERTEARRTRRTSSRPAKQEPPPPVPFPAPVPVEDRPTAVAARPTRRRARAGK